MGKSSTWANEPREITAISLPSVSVGMLYQYSPSSIIASRSVDKRWRSLTVFVMPPPKSIDDQTQEELDQLEAVDYLREAQAAEPSFCREFSVCDAPGTRANRGGGFLHIYKRDHFVESVGGREGFCPETPPAINNGAGFRHRQKRR
jgi:hypothetical protein